MTNPSDFDEEETQGDEEYVPPEWNGYEHPSDHDRDRFAEDIAREDELYQLFDGTFGDFADIDTYGGEG